jgi:hypothetical protein
VVLAIERARGVMADTAIVWMRMVVLAMERAREVMADTAVVWMRMAVLATERAKEVIARGKSKAYRSSREN